MHPDFVFIDGDDDDIGLNDRDDYLNDHADVKIRNLSTIDEAVEGAVEDDQQMGDGDQDVHSHCPQFVRVIYHAKDWLQLCAFRK